MKVALVVERFDLENPGGAEISSREIADGLVSQGIDVEVLTAQKRCPGETRFEVTGFCRPWGLPLRRVIRRANEYRLWGHLVRGRCKRRGIEIIHAIAPVRCATVYQPRSGLIDEICERNAARLSFERGRVCKPRPKPKQRLVRKIECHLAEKTNCLFLPHSEYVRRQCKKHLQLDDSRIHTVYSGIGTEALRPTLTPDILSRKRQEWHLDGCLTGIFVANNLKLKGIGVLEEALRELAKKDESLFQKLRILVCSKKGYNPPSDLIARFLTVGPIQERAGMAEAYQAADFVVHPTWHDPCSRAVLEGIAAGRPAITTAKFDGAAEVVDECGCGILIRDPGCSVELARALKRMCDDHTRRVLSDACAEAVRKIGIDRHVCELKAVYEGLKGSSG